MLADQKSIQLDWRRAGLKKNKPVARIFYRLIKLKIEQGSFFEIIIIF